jgi:hypothetical protein
MKEESNLTFSSKDHEFDSTFYYLNRDKRRDPVFNDCTESLLYKQSMFDVISSHENLVFFYRVFEEMNSEKLILFRQSLRRMPIDKFLDIFSESTP